MVGTTKYRSGHSYGLSTGDEVTEADLPVYGTSQGLVASQGGVPPERERQMEAHLPSG